MFPYQFLDQMEDEFVWGPSGNGKFTIKIATWLQPNQIYTASFTGQSFEQYVQLDFPHYL